MWTEKGDCCYAPWVCQWTSRKSAIRWPHCGNCINPRHYPKRWEKVALEFKRGVLLRDLPQLSSGNQPSVFTDQQCRQTSALRCVESGGRKKKTRAGIKLVSYFVFTSRSLHRSPPRWWILSSSACYVDCTVFLRKVSNGLSFVDSVPLNGAQSTCCSHLIRR